MEIYDSIGVLWEVQGKNKGFLFKGGSSSASSNASTSNTQTTMTDSRKAASDQAVMAENSTVTVNSLDRGLAETGYGALANVSNNALISAAAAVSNNTDLSKTALVSGNALALGSQHIAAANTAKQLDTNADVAKTALVSGNALALASQQLSSANAAKQLESNSDLSKTAILAGNALAMQTQKMNTDAATSAIQLANQNVAKQLDTNSDISKAAMLSNSAVNNRALDTVDKALAQSLSTMNNFNVEREQGQKLLFDNLTFMHDSNNAFSQAVQKETNSTVKDMAQSYADKISKNAESDSVKYVQYAVIGVIVIAIVIAFLRSGKTQKG